MPKLKVLIVVHLPLFKQANVPSNLRKIVGMDAVPRIGETLVLPHGFMSKIDEVRHRTDDGHVEIHIQQPSHVLDVVQDAAGVKILAAQLQAAGYRAITEWD